MGWQPPSYHTWMVTLHAGGWCSATWSSAVAKGGGEGGRRGQRTGDGGCRWARARMGRCRFGSQSYCTPVVCHHL